MGALVEPKTVSTCAARLAVVIPARRASVFVSVVTGNNGGEPKVLIPRALAHVHLVHLEWLPS